MCLRGEQSRVRGPSPAVFAQVSSSPKLGDERTRLATSDLWGLAGAYKSNSEECKGSETQYWQHATSASYTSFFSSESGHVIIAPFDRPRASCMMTVRTQSGHVQAQHRKVGRQPWVVAVRRGQSDLSRDIFSTEYIPACRTSRRSSKGELALSASKQAWGVE